MADFRIDVGFFTHAKTKRLKRALGLEGVYSLLQLWAYAAQNEHGPEKIYSADDIELAVDWSGELGSFVSTLELVGFLDVATGGYSIHEWEVHNGYAANAAKRSEAGRNAAKARWQKRIKCGNDAGALPEQCGNDADALPKACNGNAPFPIPIPVPTPKEEENIMHARGKRAYGSGDEATYKTKKGRKLTGKKLQQFDRFWTAFAYQRGKAEAADAFLDIQGFNDELLEVIVTAATAEAASRTTALAQGKTPKMAQGWLSCRRWEDEALDSTPTVASQVAAMRAAKGGLQ
jgi:hypothetical protein